jgi:hypothetical protein
MAKEGTVRMTQATGTLNLVKPVRGMCTPYMFYSDIELKKFKLKISKIT